MEENEGSYSISKSTLKVDGISVDSREYIERQIEDAYKAVAALAARKPLRRRQIVQVPSQQPGKVRQIVRRLETPQPDLLERVYVVEPQQNYVDLVVERPSTPAPQLRTRTVYASPEQVINEQMVKVPSKSLYPSNQILTENTGVPAYSGSGAYSYSYPQTTGAQQIPTVVTTEQPAYSGAASYSYGYDQPPYARSTSGGNVYYDYGYPGVPHLQSVNPITVPEAPLVAAPVPNQPIQKPELDVPKSKEAPKKKKGFFGRFFKGSSKEDEKVDKTGLVVYSGSGSYSVPYDYRYTQPQPYLPINYPSSAYQGYPSVPQSKSTKQETPAPEIPPAQILIPAPEQAQSIKNDRSGSIGGPTPYYPQYDYPYNYQTLPVSSDYKLEKTKTPSDRKNSGSAGGSYQYYPQYGSNFYGYSMPQSTDYIPQDGYQFVDPSNSAGNYFYGYGYPGQNPSFKHESTAPGSTLIPIPGKSNSNGSQQYYSQYYPPYGSNYYTYPVPDYIPQEEVPSAIQSNSAGQSFYGYGYPGQSLPYEPIPAPGSGISSKGDTKRTGSIGGNYPYYPQYYYPQYGSNYYGYAFPQSSELVPKEGVQSVIPSNSGDNTLYSYGYPGQKYSYKYEPIAIQDPNSTSIPVPESGKSGSIGGVQSYYPQYYYPQYGSNYYGYPNPQLTDNTPKEGVQSGIPSSSGDNALYSYGYPGQKYSYKYEPISASIPGSEVDYVGASGYYPQYYYPQYGSNYYPVPQSADYITPESNQSVVPSNSAGNTFYGYGYPGRKLSYEPIGVPAKSSKNSKKTSGSIGGSPSYYPQYYDPQYGSYYYDYPFPQSNYYMPLDPNSATASGTPRSVASKKNSIKDINSQYDHPSGLPVYSGSYPYAQPYYYNYDTTQQQPRFYYPSGAYISEQRSKAASSYLPEPAPQEIIKINSRIGSDSFDTVTEIADSGSADKNNLTPEIDKAYENAMSKRQPVLKRQVIKLPGQPGQVKRVVRRVPTPTPDQIERVFVVKHQRDVINLVIERPSTPPPQIKTRTIYARPRKAIINSQVVRVAPRGQAPDQQQISGFQQDNTQYVQPSQPAQPAQLVHPVQSSDNAGAVQSSNRSVISNNGVYQYYPQYGGYSTGYPPNIGLPAYGSVVYPKAISNSYTQPSAYIQSPSKNISATVDYPSAYGYYSYGYPNVPIVDQTTDSRQSILIKPQDEPNNELVTSSTSQTKQSIKQNPYQYYYPPYNYSANYGIPAYGSSAVYPYPYPYAYTLPQSASNTIPSAIIPQQQPIPFPSIVPSNSAGNAYYGYGYPSQQPSFQYEPVPAPTIQPTQYEQIPARTSAEPVSSISKSRDTTIKPTDYISNPQYGGYSTGYPPNLVYNDPAVYPYSYNYGFPRTTDYSYSYGYPSVHQEIPSVSMPQQPSIAPYSSVLQTNLPGNEYYYDPTKQPFFQYDQVPASATTEPTASNSKRQDSTKPIDSSYYPQYGGYSTGYPPNLSYPYSYNYNYPGPSASNDYPSVIYKPGHSETVPISNSSYTRRSKRSKSIQNLPIKTGSGTGAELIGEYIGIETSLHSTAEGLNKTPKEIFDENLGPEIEEAYEAYVSNSKNRKPTIRRQIIKLQGEPGKVRNIVRRVPTPKADVIERVFVVEPENEVVNLVIERPDTPQPKLKTSTVYPRPGKPIILHQKVVTVPPRGSKSQENEIYEQQQSAQAGYYSYNYNQPSYDYAYTQQYPSKVESNAAYYGYPVTGYN